MAKPKFSVSEITTFHQTFEEDLASYAAAGVEGIGVWEFKLPEGDDAETVAKLKDERAQGDDLHPGHALDLPGAVPRPGRPGRAHRASCAPRSAASRRSSREVVLCLPGAPRDGADPAEARRVIVDGLRQAAKVAAEHGLTLGLEPLHREVYGTWTTVDDDPGDDRADGRDRRAEREAPLRRLPPPRHRQRARRHRAPRRPHLAVDPHLRLARPDAQRLRPGAARRRDHRPARDLRRARRRRTDGWVDLEIFSDDGSFTRHGLRGLALEAGCGRRRSRAARPGFDAAWAARRPPADAARGQGRARHGRRARARHRPRHGARARGRGRRRRRERRRCGRGGGAGVRRRAARQGRARRASTSPTCRCGPRSTR